MIKRNKLFLINNIVLGAYIFTLVPNVTALEVEELLLSMNTSENNNNNDYGNTDEDDSVVEENNEFLDYKDLNMEESSSEDNNSPTAMESENIVSETEVNIRNSSNLVSYVDGVTKVNLNDINSTKVVSDTWNYNDVKTIHIDATFTSNDKKYIEFSVPLGMKIHSDVNRLVDGRNILSVDLSEYRQTNITTSNNYTHMPDCGKIVFEIANDTSIISLDILVSIDEMFWNTVNNTSATSSSDNAIEVSILDGADVETKKLDKVIIVGKSWNPHYTYNIYNDNTDITSIPTDTTVTISSNISPDWWNKRYTRIYKKIVAKYDLIQYKTIVDGQEVIKRPTLKSIKLTNGGTYRVDGDTLICEWTNVAMDYVSLKANVVFEDSEFPEGTKMTMRRQGVWVEDYFTGEMKKIASEGRSNITTVSKYTEQMKLHTRSETVYKDLNIEEGKVISLLGAVEIGNQGYLSSTKVMNIDFPYGSSSGIGVTTMRLPALQEESIFDINYVLWDRKTGEEFSSKVTVKKPAASNNYTGYLFNIDTAIANLPSSIDVSNREFYFKNINYEIGKIPTKYRTSVEYDERNVKSSGNFYGYVFNSNGDISNKTTVTITSLNDDGSKIKDDCLSITTTVSDVGTSIFGIKEFGFYDENNEEISNSVSGNNIVLKGSIANYQTPSAKASSSYISNPIVYLKLPKGITMDKSATKFNIVRGNKSFSLNWEILNESNPRVSSDGQYVYEIAFFGDSTLIGYYTPELSSYGHMTYNIKLDVSRSVKTISLNAKDILFVDDKYMSIPSNADVWVNYIVSDKYDINNNGSTSDSIGTYGDNIYLNIVSNGNWLDTQFEVSLNGGEYTLSPIEVGSVDDKISMRFSIDNYNEGVVKKENFYYYIPIPKNNINYNSKIKDSSEKFEFNLTLDEFIDVPEGLDVLYSIDGKNYYDKSKIKDISKVCMIKVVATRDIVNGDKANIIINTSIDGVSEFVDGDDIIFSPYGYQKYEKNGTASVFNHVFGKVTISGKEVIEDNWLNREVAKQVGKTIDTLKSKDFLKITTISLPNEGLTGEIPKSIKKLVNLKTLNLSENNLSGEIPEELWSLTNLSTLNLGVNSFEGKISKSISNLTSLNYLFLRDNNFFGEIFNNIYSLQELKRIDIRHNNFEGAITNKIKNLKNLGTLIIEGNNFSGNLPAEIGALDKVFYLNIRDNNFTGEIPKEIGNMNSLESLYMHNNNFSGEVPTTISNLSALKELGLADNNLSGVLNIDFTKLNNLTALNISNNQFIGLNSTLPDKFKTEAVLRGNLIEGMSNQKEIVINEVSDINVEIGSKLSIPSKYKNVSVVWNGNAESLSSYYKLEYYIDDTSLFDSKLYAANLGNTTLRAKITQAAASNTNAMSVNGYNIDVEKKYVPLKMSLSQNIKTWTKGEAIITVTTTGSEDLEYILLPDGTKITDGGRDCEFAVSKNGTYEFTARTIKGEEVTSKIVVKYIDNDAPTATISEKVDSNGNITLTVKAVDSGSRIKSITTPEGKVVTSATCKYEVPSDGTYSFIITDKVGNTEVVTYSATGIILDDTWLAKEVARQVKKKVEDLTVEDFEKITKINLSNKNIKGKIPDYIGLLTNVTAFKVNGNSIAGNIPDEIGNMTNLKTLWLTDNRLTGNIPSSIGSLENLEELDLGLNFLDGSIPSELGNLPKIKAIYLCENKLTGEIPVELGNLETLTSICLDFNNLTGNVPKKVMSLRAAKNFEGNQLDIQL